MRKNGLNREFLVSPLIVAYLPPCPALLVARRSSLFPTKKASLGATPFFAIQLRGLWVWFVAFFRRPNFGVSGSQFGFARCEAHESLHRRTVLALGGFLLGCLFLGDLLLGDLLLSSFLLCHGGFLSPDHSELALHFTEKSKSMSTQFFRTVGNRYRPFGGRRLNQSGEEASDER